MTTPVAVVTFYLLTYIATGPPLPAPYSDPSPQPLSPLLTTITIIAALYPWTASGYIATTAMPTDPLQNNVGVPTSSTMKGPSTMGVPTLKTNIESNRSPNIEDNGSSHIES